MFVGSLPWYATQTLQCPSHACINASTRNIATVDLSRTLSLDWLLQRCATTVAARHFHSITRVATMSSPLNKFQQVLSFRGLPNRGASLVPLSTPSFCRPNRGASLVPLSTPSPAWQILAPWYWGRKTRFSNGLPNNRIKVSGSWAEIDGSHINCSRYLFPCMSKKTWEWLG